MEHLSFFTEDIQFDISNESKLSSWVQHLITSHQKITGEITYIFCSDSYLHTLNLEHLNHDTLTDIITFDYTSTGIISGDIFISIERVTENAEQFNVSFDRELNRVMAHGVLHLIGFKDKTEGEKKEMRAEEDKALSLLDSL